MPLTVPTPWALPMPRPSFSGMSTGCRLLPGGLHEDTSSIKCDSKIRKKRAWLFLKLLRNERKKAHSWFQKVNFKRIKIGITSNFSSFLSKGCSAAAAAAKSLQSYPTLCDPIDSSSPGSPSLGFSRQEHWIGLPFPSPMHESEK